MERFYQGHNVPLVLILPESVGDAEYVRVKITSALGADVKAWNKADLTITDQVVICPITQTESATWPAGMAKVSVHWLFDGEAKESAEDFSIMICRDNDTTVLGDDTAVTLSEIEIDASKIPDPAEIKTAMLRHALVIQAGTVSDDQVKAAVENYLEENPVSVNAENVPYDSTTDDHTAGSTAEALYSLKENISTMQGDIDELQDNKIWTEDAGEAEDVPTPSGSGVTAEQAKSLFALLKKVKYSEAPTDDERTAFEQAWGVASATLTGITVSYTGGAVDAGTPTSSLAITVTAVYSDDTTKAITSGYTLYPTTIVEGDNTVTVTYLQKNAEFAVTGNPVTKTLDSISATYSGGSVTVGTALSELTGITVTGHYSDDTTAELTGYTLSGEISTVGDNTITVTYGELTCTFVVAGTEATKTVYGVSLAYEAPDYNQWSSNGNWFRVSYNSNTAAIQVGNGFSTEKMYSKAIDGNAYRYIRIPCLSGNEYSVASNFKAYGGDSPDSLTESGHPVTLCSSSVVGFYSGSYDDSQDGEGYMISKINDAFDYYYIVCHAVNNSLAGNFPALVGVFDEGILDDPSAEPTE